MSPSILMIQEAGGNLANKSFRESECLKRAFTALNIRSEIWGLNQPTFAIPFKEMVKGFDVVIQMENYPSKKWLPNLKRIKQLKLFWSVDSHYSLNEHLKIARDIRAQIHLNSSEQYIHYFKNTYDKAFWFPNAVDDTLIYPKNVLKDTIEVGFCGSMIGDRDTWLNSIQVKYPQLRKDIFVIGDAMVNALNAYKISLNHSIGDDINFRVFETLSCQTFLLTNNVFNLSRLFSYGKHLIVYTSQNDLLDKIEFYLRNEYERKQIALAGFEHIKSFHTYHHRAAFIRDILVENL